MTRARWSKGAKVLNTEGRWRLLAYERAGKGKPVLQHICPLRKTRWGGYDWVQMAPHQAQGECALCGDKIPEKIEIVLGLMKL